MGECVSLISDCPLLPSEPPGFEYKALVNTQQQGVPCPTYFVELETILPIDFKKCNLKGP